MQGLGGEKSRTFKLWPINYTNAGNKIKIESHRNDFSRYLQKKSREERQRQRQRNIAR